VGVTTAAALAEWHRYRPQTILATTILRHMRPYWPQKMFVFGYPSSV